MYRTTRRLGRTAAICASAAGLLVAGVLAATPASAAGGPITVTGQGSTLGGRTLTISGDTFEVGEEITVSGSGWLKKDGAHGSVLGFKIMRTDDGAQLKRVAPYALSIPDADDRPGTLGGNPAPLSQGAWAFANADTDGDFSVTFDLPDGTTSGSDASSDIALTPGSYYIQALVGSFGGTDPQTFETYDVQGGIGYSTSPALYDTRITVVSEHATPPNPEDPVDPQEPVDPDKTRSGAIDLDVSVPGTGGLALNIADSRADLGEAALNPAADALVADGLLPLVTVTDTRSTDPGWNVVGKVSDFAGAAGATIDGKHLGWTPEVVSTGDGQRVTAGTAVAAGAGFAGGATLGKAEGGTGRGTAELGAGLELKVPTNVPAGAYSATITLTLS